jgi:regulator of sirC expression with transglutaminase-like and TPR domain
MKDMVPRASHIPRRGTRCTVLSVNAWLQRFADAVDKPEGAIELDSAASLIGAIAQDGALDVDKVKRTLDGFADAAARLGARTADSPELAAEILRRTLHGELGLRGDSEEFYDPRNSFLHEVIERRRGIPISLSAIYLEVARRLGIGARGIGFPGHFLVRLELQRGGVYIDPFHGGSSLDQRGLRELVRRSRGEGAELEPQMLEPVSKKALLTRMLHNLAGIYGKRNDWLRSLAVLERLALLDAGNQRIAKALADLRARAHTLN